MRLLQSNLYVLQVPILLNGMKNTKLVGDISEAKLMAAMLAKGYPVSIPFSDNERYDFIIEKGNKLCRVQCKTARLDSHDSVYVDARSCSTNGKIRKNYAGQVDYFGAYCPDNDRCYLVPAGEISTTAFTLRTRDPKIADAKGRQIKLAKDYEL